MIDKKMVSGLHTIRYFYSFEDWTLHSSSIQSVINLLFKNVQIHKSINIFCEQKEIV